jgi:hypothetical protein
VAQTHPRSNLPAAVAAQNLVPISSCVSTGWGHTGQCTVAARLSIAFASGVVLADPVKICLQLPVVLPHRPSVIGRSSRTPRSGPDPVGPDTQRLRRRRRFRSQLSRPRPPAAGDGIGRHRADRHPVLDLADERTRHHVGLLVPGRVTTDMGIRRGRRRPCRRHAKCSRCRQHYATGGDIGRLRPRADQARATAVAATVSCRGIAVRARGRKRNQRSPVGPCRTPALSGPLGATGGAAAAARLSRAAWTTASAVSPNCSYSTV